MMKFKKCIGALAFLSLFTLTANAQMFDEKKTSLIFDGEEEVGYGFLLRYYSYNGKAAFINYDLESTVVTVYNHEFDNVKSFKCPQLAETYTDEEIEQEPEYILSGYEESDVYVSDSFWNSRTISGAYESFYNQYYNVIWYNPPYSEDEYSTEEKVAIINSITLSDEYAFYTKLMRTFFIHKDEIPSGVNKYEWIAEKYRSECFTDEEWAEMTTQYQIDMMNDYSSRYYKLEYSGNVYFLTSEFDEYRTEVTAYKIVGLNVYRLYLVAQYTPTGNYVTIGTEKFEYQKIGTYGYLNVDDYYEAWGLFTQTLFNNDEKYEFLMPQLEPRTYVSKNWRGNRCVKNEYCIVGYDVYNEDGKVLASLKIDTEGGKRRTYEPTIYRVDGTDYIFLETSIYELDDEGYHHSTDYKTFIYKINKSTSSVQKVQEMRGSMHIRPSVVGKDEEITIDLKDTDIDVDRELIITNMKGQAVERRSVPAGEAQVRVPASFLNSGVHHISLQREGHPVDGGKVIVK